MQENMKINQRDIWECDEDDLFYAELRRQVLLLTAEDDEECQENRHPNTAKSLQQRFNTSPPSLLQPGCYYNWSGNHENGSVPTWLFNLWKPGNGTGVFIPQIIKSRRRYRPRKKNNERGRMYKSAVANVE
ncbi:hypothetical protein ACH5RR_030247 [Cinchona calisaya]|uniref:Uncharacterized protein n=1 Tax=Cinchona calisaya TaxID=153742 RepID=A0ABD2YU18_9GENT